MWFFISEPNGTIHELILPKECFGIDCLQMVRSRKVPIKLIQSLKKLNCKVISLCVLIGSVWNKNNALSK